MLFVEVKDDAWANTARQRLQAEEQIRKRFREILPYCALQRCYGLSVLGTALRAYTSTGHVDSGVVEPAFAEIPGPNQHVPSDLLEGDCQEPRGTGFGSLKKGHNSQFDVRQATVSGPRDTSLKRRLETRTA